MAHAPAAPRSFAALRHPAYRVYLVGNMLAMMADSIEHAISYWVIGHQFHSPALGGFASLVHWLPFLLFSVWSGSLADRFDPRRIIQIGMGLFMLASLGWGWFFMTGTLEKWHAMVILTVHGFAGVFWAPASQLLIHEIVGGPQLQSAVRMMSTSRVLGLLAGPAIGGFLLEAVGPAVGIFINVLIYLPLTLWLWKAPYGPRFHKGEAVEARPRQRPPSWADMWATLRMIVNNRVIVCMTLLAGAASFFVGNGYQPQIPLYLADFGHGASEFFYTIMMAANGAGALTAGIILESGGLLAPRPRTAFFLLMGWCVAIGSFALVDNFWIAIALLVAAGFLDLSFGSMTQTIVQLGAPAEIRGRVLGLFNTAYAGFRAVPGITIGVGGELVGIHWSLAICAAALLVSTAGLLTFLMRAAHVEARASPGE
jgi:MFS family permease